MTGSAPWEVDWPSPGALMVRMEDKDGGTVVVACGE